MKTLNASAEPKTLDDLAAKHTLSKSTAHRILSALVSEGMATQDPATRMFSSGPESFAAGLQSAVQVDIRSMARPILKKISALSGETATLEIRIDDEMLILDEVHSRRLVGARAEIGTRWPMYATSSGKAILATSDESDFYDYVGRPRKQLTKHTLVGEEEFKSSIQAGLKAGYWLSVEELQPAFSAVSAPMYDQKGVVLGALSVGGPAERLGPSRLRELGLILVEELSSI
jgi:IclR family acetate operon transcriptional repressor